MAAPSAAMCSRGRLEVLDDATHWVQHDAPATVNRLLLDHLGAGNGRRGNGVKFSSE
jgi:pimeloyl-ACP methyl ester carboxylesterase